MHEETFHLPEGVAILRVPEKLSPASVQDLEDRLAIVIRQLKRTSSEAAAAAKAEARK